MTHEEGRIGRDGFAVVREAVEPDSSDLGVDVAVTVRFDNR